MGALLSNLKSTILSGRRRDRGCMFGDWRLLRRCHRCHVELRAWHRIEDRSDRPRDQRGIAARDCGFPAGRTIDRLADQDGAIRSLSGCLWTQRGCTDPRPRGTLAERLLRGRDRSCTHCTSPHDARDVVERRLPRERRGAVAATGSRYDAEDHDKHPGTAQCG